MTDLRGAVAAAMPEGAFLRRDRGDALYITNAPAKGWNGPPEGFRAEINGATARLFPTAALMEACDLEPDRLAYELRPFRGASDEALKLFAACVKCAENPEEAVYMKCDRMLRQSAAKALREGGGEGLYYCALALAEAGRRLNEKTGGK